MEVLLRVKQARNPAFTFLMPQDAMYPYYRWIVETNPQVRGEERGERGESDYYRWIMETDPQMRGGQER